MKFTTFIFKTSAEEDQGSDSAIREGSLNPRKDARRKSPLHGRDSEGAGRPTRTGLCTTEPCRCMLVNCYSQSLAQRPGGNVYHSY